VFVAEESPNRANLSDVDSRTLDLHTAARPRWKLLLADGVWLLHTAVVAFFTFGCTLPWRWALWTTLTGALVMRIHWWRNGGVCILTQLESVLRRGPSDPRHAPVTTDDTFVSSLSRAVLGRPLSASLVDALTHCVLWVGAGVSALRLVLT